MSYATWNALRLGVNDDRWPNGQKMPDRQMNERRRIGFGEQEPVDKYEGRYMPRENGEINMPWHYPPWPQGEREPRREMRMVEPITDRKRRYRRYENGRFRPYKNSMNGEYMTDEYDEEEAEEDEEIPPEHKSAEAGGSLWMRPQNESVHPLTKEEAKAWVQSMTVPDPNNKNTGGKMTWDEVKAMAHKAGITDENKMPEYYAVTNAMKSDYYKVAQRFGIVAPEFYFDLAKAFINDEDAKLHKTALYYKYIAAK